MGNISIKGGRRVLGEPADHDKEKMGAKEFDKTGNLR